MLMYSDAITLADRCFPVNGNKSPKVGNWKGHTDGASDARLFGVPVPNGAVVIDHDSYKPGSISTEELASKLGISTEVLSAAHLQTTRNGGSHYAFTVPEGADIPNTVDVWPGVDIRSAGRGYIASGRGYTDAEGAPIGRAAIELISRGPSLDPAPLCKRSGVAKRITGGDLDDDDSLAREVANQPMDLTFEQVRAVVMATDVVEHHAKWFDLMAGLHHQTRGSEEAWELLDGWSQLGANYDFEGNRTRWDSLSNGKARPTSFALWLKLTKYRVKDSPKAKARTKGKASRLRFGSDGYDFKCDYLIKGVLPANSLAAIYGPSGSYKSFAALDLACCVAAGRDWDGCRVKQGAVLYIAAEGGTGVSRRIKAWEQRKNGGQRVSSIAVLQEPAFVANGDEQEEVLECISSIKAQTGLDVNLIVIDTVARSFGGADENKASDMGAFIAGCDEIKGETGACVLLVHHSGKDVDKGARGSSALRAALDTEFLIQRETPAGKAFTMRCMKQKDGEERRATAYDLAEDVVAIDEEGDDVTSMVVLDAGREPVMDVPEALAGSNLSGNHLQLWEAINQREESDGVCELDMLRDDCRKAGMAMNNFSRYLRKLEQDGTVVLDKASGVVSIP